MSSDTKSFINSACMRVLRPLASIVLKCGMTWREFSDLSKSAFVESATLNYGINGRPTNVSRVSILTGISRKEVKRQRDLLATKAPVVGKKTTDATRVLSGWHQDPIFLDAGSLPKILSEKGSTASFETLCTKYGGDVSTAAMLKELLKTQSIQRTDDGQLQVLKRYYQPAAHDDELLMYAMTRIEDLADAMHNNVFPDKKHQPRFEGSAFNDRISPDMIPQFKKFLDERGQKFLEDVDDWLTKNAADDDKTTERVRLGVGMYAIENNEFQENSK